MKHTPSPQLKDCNRWACNLWSGNNPATNGSWRVIGNAGAIAGHSIPVGYDTVFVMQRPNPKVGAGENNALPAYLQVSLLQVATFQEVSLSILISFNWLPLVKFDVIIVRRWYLEATTETNACLQVANSTNVEYHSFYNMTSNTYTGFHIAEAPFCSGHAYMPDGKVLMAGGKQNKTPAFLPGPPPFQVVSCTLDVIWVAMSVTMVITSVFSNPQTVVLSSRTLLTSLSD